MAPRRAKVALLLVLLAAAAPLAGCLTGDAPPPGPGNNSTGENGNGNGPGDGDGDALRLLFNGTRAYGHVEAQVLRDDGTVRYRIPGTPGRAEAADLIARSLRDAGWQVARQRWNGTYLCEEVPLENVVATLPGATNRTIMLGAHYDTRPWADRDPDPDKRDDPVPGANDGASGVGVLLEMARVIAAGPELNHTVRLVFFDAEDGGSPPAFAACGENPWIIGSTHYAQGMSAAEVARTEAFILVDLVGDVDLELRRERYSAQPPHRALQDRLWAAGAALGHDQFVDALGIPVVDDHRPFQDRGIVAVDVIHLDDSPDGWAFPDTHHKTSDDLGNVSVESLGAVGRTVEWVVRDLDRDPLDA